MRLRIKRNARNGLWLLLLSLLTKLAFAESQPTVRGVNYDPMHSFEFIKAVGTNDESGMREAILIDLGQLDILRSRNQDDRDPGRGTFYHINHIRTYFTVFASNSGMARVNIADVVHDWNSQHQVPGGETRAYTLALGVYEFRPHVDACKTEDVCRAWTQVQVQGAIDAAQKYPGLIDRIIVDNEGAAISDADSDPNDASNIRERIVEDITTIKEALDDADVKNITVGTAQTYEVAKQMLAQKMDYAPIMQAIDFLGINLYPYFYAKDYGEHGKNYGSNIPDTACAVKQFMANTWKDLLDHNALKKEIIMTEEGWPSAGNPMGDALPQPDKEHDYFYYWYNRDNTPRAGIPVSYIFSLFDKLPGQAPADYYDVESHWGLLSVDGAASLLDDASKPMNKNHIVVNFQNQIANTEQARNVTLSVCNDSSVCFPIYGYVGSGDIPAGVTKPFLIDTADDSTGGLRRTYTSLFVSYYDDNNLPKSFCHINLLNIQKMKNNSTVKLRLVDAGGNCDLSGE